MRASGNLIRRTSPLQQAGIAQREVLAGQVRIREITDLGLLRLRFFTTPSSATKPIAELPVGTGQCSGADPAYLCLGPNEWLVISRSAKALRSTEPLRPVIDAQQAVATDLTDALVVLRLTGPAAPWLLGKLSCLDFLAGTQHGTHCARTRLGHTAVTVHYHRPADDDWAFDVIADRSVAGYLWELLCSSAPHANELNQAFGAFS